MATPRVEYNDLLISLTNPEDNISVTYPLVQGTSVTLRITVKNGTEEVTFNDIDDVSVFIACYCKLDNAPVILPIDKTELSLSGNELLVTGRNITSHEGKCAVILRYSNGYTTYSTPLYYYVNSNPTAGIDILPPIEQL